ncbi:MAG: hypothetical protein IV112_21405 [Methyloversatilis discipulorum]|uniref:StbB family protein n=1 Tax=Methyloversatilis discipulorum TaxID=1119528 RepID=UPI0026ECDC45|nr:StbB family protein [Methyloversatilis discipulorum]MBT9519245.1 hypothetical protein [Methyloversatilis discipulorum]
MKIAVLNFSGNVGKTTIARHLLLPRIPGAALIAVESINADDDHQGQSLRGRQFAELQEYLQTVDSAVVDIGASNVEELLGLMHRYRGSQEDFDAFVIPTVPALKQQRDTTATLLEMSRLGVPASRLKIVFNMVEEDSDITQTFEPLLEFLLACPVATASIRARLSANEIYGRVKSMEVAPDLIQLSKDTTDFKSLILKSAKLEEKLALAQALANRRLAFGVVPELDACFAALELVPVPA